MNKFRNWLAKKVGDFAINHIASPEYSRNLKTVILLGERTWQRLAIKEMDRIQQETLPK